MGYLELQKELILYKKITEERKEYIESKFSTTSFLKDNIINDKINTIVKNMLISVDFDFKKDRIDKDRFVVEEGKLKYIEYKHKNSRSLRQ